MLKQIPELLSRITIGYVFLESGIGKLQNLPKVTAFFESLNIPFASIQAPMVSCFEVIFGFFILVGFLTRLSAIPLIGIMTVALLTAKAAEITDFSALLGMIEFLYIVILLWLATHGSQSLSVDRWRGRRKSSKS
jgi:putative oxidoreductase